MLPLPARPIMAAKGVLPPVRSKPQVKDLDIRKLEYCLELQTLWGFPVSSVSKVSACNAGDPGLIPGSERSPGDGGGYPLQYSCLENPMNREARQATVHGVTKSQTRLSD